MEKTEYDRLTESIIGSAIAVHRALGPGLLESANEACLAFELVQRGHDVLRQVALPVKYRGVSLDCGYRMDLIVDGAVVVELKAVSELHALHRAQLLSYWKLSGHHVGLLINFHVLVLKDGIKRLVLGLPE